MMWIQKKSKTVWFLVIPLAVISFALLTVIMTIGLPARGSVATTVVVPDQSVSDGSPPIVPVVSPPIVAVPVPVQPGFPVRLRIPKIHIDTAIENVGLTKQGAVDVPKDIASVAWYNLGPRPGEIGSAVIDGHYGWKNGIPAVFTTLHKLQAGDQLSIVDAAGVSRTFVVRKVQVYHQHDAVASVFGVDDGQAHLNLITCEGIWSAAQQSYNNRLVVFTDEVST